MGHLAAVALLLSAAAQAPSADPIARQLNSQDAQTIAWGAYNAGAYHRVDAIPRLQQILEFLPLTAPTEERALIAVVMDALIQLKAKVPARLLLPYLEKRPVHTFVLLSSATDREGALLELLPRLSGTQWFAAANMLFEDRSPGLIEHLVQTARLQLTVHVADTENVGFGIGAGVSSVSIACGIGQDPPAYPPHAEYRFGWSPEPGLIVLATGPHPVYYSRTVTTAVQYPVSEASTGGPNDEDRIDYLRAMSPETGGSPFRAHTVETVTWSSPEALSLKVRELRSLVERRFRSLADRARPSRSIPWDVVMEPPIDLHIVDQRTDRAVPLPKFDR
jgi:hypothetical protein